MLALITAAAPSPGGRGLEIKADGRAEVVFSWRQDGCDRGDVPDAPARAFRDFAGKVHLYAANHNNRGLIGADLHSVRPAGCQSALRGAENADPSQYDDRAWLTSFWTTNGRTVYALTHNEYLGNKHHACKSARSIDCWMNAITLARSEDGGSTFRRAGAGSAALVAALPYRYDPDGTGHWGLFSPSNVFQAGDYLYVTAHTTAYREQRAGECLLRTDRIASPASWRAWDGHDFTRSFVNPYASPGLDPREHVCAPIGNGQLRWPVGAIVRHEKSGKFVAVMAGGNGNAAGVYAATSGDLVHWTAPRLVIPTQTKQGFDCRRTGRDQTGLGGYAVAYPSIMDAESRSANFDTVGDTADLYLVRYEPEGCKIDTLKRDLVRIRITMQGF